MPSITADHSYIAAKRTGGIAVDIRGTGTAWTPGTPGSPSFTISGVAGCSISKQIVDSPTLARLVIVTGSTTGTLTISDGTLTATLQVKLVSRARGRWVPGM